MRADLHVHTTASDGRVPPERMVRYAAAGNLDVVAVTDHDTLAGVLPAMDAGPVHGVAVLPGIEISCRWEEMEVHLLGYGIDPNDSSLLELQSSAGGRRADRMEAMVERLGEIGVPIDMEAVHAVAPGGEGATLSRAHLAQALLRGGHIGHFGEAFERYIGTSRPAFVDVPLPPMEEAIDRVGAAGGTAVWAHPPTGLLAETLGAFVEVGLEGVECYRANLTAAEIDRAVASTRSAGLFPTGGSDWHGRPGHRLGEFAVKRTTLGPFLDRLRDTTTGRDVVNAVSGA